MKCAGVRRGRPSVLYAKHLKSAEPPQEDLVYFN